MFLEDFAKFVIFNISGSYRIFLKFRELEAKVLLGKTIERSYCTETAMQAAVRSPIS